MLLLFVVYGGGRCQCLARILRTLFPAWFWNDLWNQVILEVALLPDHFLSCLQLGFSVLPWIYPIDINLILKRYILVAVVYIRTWIGHCLLFCMSLYLFGRCVLYSIVVCCLGLRYLKGEIGWILRLRYRAPRYCNWCCLRFQFVLLLLHLPLFNIATLNVYLRDDLLGWHHWQETLWLIVSTLWGIVIFVRNAMRLRNARVIVIYGFFWSFQNFLVALNSFNLISSNHIIV